MHIFGRHKISCIGCRNMDLVSHYKHLKISTLKQSILMQPYVAICVMGLFETQNYSNLEITRLSILASKVIRLVEDLRKPSISVKERRKKSRLAANQSQTRAPSQRSQLHLKIRIAANVSITRLTASASGLSILTFFLLESIWNGSNKASKHPLTLLKCPPDLGSCRWRQTPVVSS